MAQESSEPKVGIAVSGGGVRSAAFAFGGLQALQERRGLVHGPRHAHSLSAVSGGSYIAAAVLSALGGSLDTPTHTWPGRRWQVDPTDLTPDGHPVYLDETETTRPTAYHRSRRHTPSADPLTDWRTVPADDPLRPGSEESDYLRVHARYLLERSVLVTALRFGALFLLPVLATLSFTLLVGLAARAVADLVGSWLLLGGAILGVVLTMAALSDVVDSRRRSGALTERREVAYGDVASAFGLLAALTAGAMLYGVVEDPLSDWFDTSAPQLVTRVLAIGGLSTATLGPALVALVRSQLAAAPDSGTRLSRLGRLLRRLLVATMQLLLLVLVPVTVLAAFVVGWLHRPVGLFGDTVHPGWVAAGVVSLVLLLAAFRGDAVISPHTAYRDLLSRAFSFMRQTREKAGRVGTTDGERVRVTPRPISPPLSALAREDLPDLCICASVNITEPGVAAAGAHARPIVFSPQRVEIAGVPGGRMETRDYETLIGRPARFFRHSFDGSVMSYVALTGAAVSPSMGKFTKYWLRQVMTILNLRLGAWIPNPASPQAFDGADTSGFSHRLNRCPGLVLWFREFRGRHYVSSRHVYVSDGGHYENLGIVELVRRGCTEIWALDASNDDRGSWRSLAESLNLISSELGCTVEGDFAGFAALPEDEDPTRRLVHATTTDVHVSGLREKDLAEGEEAPVDPELVPYSCVIHVVRLGMTTRTSPVIRELGSRYKRFPYDSTLNQLYTAERFDLYRSLGYDSTRAALDAVAARSAAAKKATVKKATVKKATAKKTAATAAPARRATATKAVPGAPPADRDDDG
jgi:hypothetical protein